MMYMYNVLPLATANIHHSLPDLVELIFCLDGLADVSEEVVCDPILDAADDIRLRGGGGMVTSTTKVSKVRGKI